MSAWQDLNLPRSSAAFKAAQNGTDGGRWGEVRRGGRGGGGEAQLPKRNAPHSFGFPAAFPDCCPFDTPAARARSLSQPPPFSRSVRLVTINGEPVDGLSKYDVSVLLEPLTKAEMVWQPDPAGIIDLGLI